VVGRVEQIVGAVEFNHRAWLPSLSDCSVELSVLSHFS
jgi:hypothetical protein